MAALPGGNLESAATFIERFVQTSFITKGGPTLSPIKGSSSEGLFGATLGFFIGFAAVSLFGPTAHTFKDVMQLSPVLVGLLVAMPSLSGSLLRIPFSAWVDTTGGRKPFLVLLALSIVGMLGLTLVVYLLYPDQLNAGLYPLLLLLGLLSGCGIATFSVGISQVSYWFPQARQGWALGTYAGVGNIAPGLFSFLLPIALGSFGLAGSYLAWLIFLVVGTLLYYVLGRNAWYFQLLAQDVPADTAKQTARQHGQELFPAGNMIDSLVLSAKVWKTWVLVVLYFTTFGGFIALTAWLPTYWNSFFAVSAVSAGMLTALYSILTSVIRIAGGSISDRIGGENTAILSLLTMLVGGILMTASHNYGLSVFGEILMALGMGTNNAAVFKLVPQEVPEAVGGAAGWVGGLGAFGGFAIPPIMGAFVRAQGDLGYAQGFATFVVLAVLSLLLANVLKRTHVRVPVTAAHSEGV
jgi:NNP family nitrate/nitrite transporter-like MFS transporter